MLVAIEAANGKNMRRKTLSMGLAMFRTSQKCSQESFLCFQINAFIILLLSLYKPCFFIVLVLTQELYNMVVIRKAVDGREYV